MKPREKRLAEQEAKNLRAELVQLEARLLRFNVKGFKGAATNTTEQLIDKIKRKITQLNVK